MKFRCSFLLLILIAGCGEEAKENAGIIVENGDISGTVINKETGEPVEGACVDIGGKIAYTDAKGGYLLKDIPLSDKLNVIVTANNYKEYKDVISLNQELLIFNIGLIPVESPSAQVLAVLSAISQDISALDPNKAESIQTSYFSKDYIAADDEATAFGVFAGVVPPDYNGVPDTIRNIAKKYSKLRFEFANPDVKISGISASVQMRFMVFAETKPPEPKEWEIVVDGKINLRKQDGDWKIVHWQLIPPFLKFEERPI